MPSRDADMPAHPHLLFITPSSRFDSKRPKIMQKESFCVNLKYKNESYELDTTNHPYLPDSGILGAKFWNQETKEIQLGPEGLKITVAKALSKPGMNAASLSVKAMKEFRGNSEQYVAFVTKNLCISFILILQIYQKMLIWNK